MSDDKDTLPKGFFITCFLSTMALTGLVWWTIKLVKMMW